MAVDKGYTKQYLQEIGRRAKKGDEFNLTDLTNVDTGLKSSVTNRFVKHGIIERVSTGRYKLLVDEPWNTYKQHVAEWRRGPRKKRKGKEGFVPSAISNGQQHQQHQGPDLKIVPYGEYNMIFIGRRIFLATEVILTPKERKE